jgi:hypothetical protein
MKVRLIILALSGLVIIGAIKVGIDFMAENAPIITLIATIIGVVLWVRFVSR